MTSRKRDHPGKEDITEKRTPGIRVHPEKVDIVGKRTIGGKGRQEKDAKGEKGTQRKIKHQEKRGTNQ